MRALNNLLLQYSDHFYFPGHSLPLTSRSKMFRFIDFLALGFLCLTSSSQARVNVSRHLVFVLHFTVSHSTTSTHQNGLQCGLLLSSKLFYFLHFISLFSSKAETCSIYQRFCRLARGSLFFQDNLGDLNCLQIGNFHALTE